MANGFTVWSPFDGLPIPAQNEQVRDSLLAEGYLLTQPNAEDVPEPATELLGPPTVVAELPEDAGVPEGWQVDPPDEK